MRAITGGIPSGRQKGRSRRTGPDMLDLWWRGFRTMSHPSGYRPDEAAGHRACTMQPFVRKGDIDD